MRRVPVVVVASAPDYCAVCAGAREVALAWPRGGPARIACPHCTPPARAVPILYLPPREATTARRTA